MALVTTGLEADTCPVNATGFCFVLFVLLFLKRTHVTACMHELARMLPIAE